MKVKLTGVGLQLEHEIEEDASEQVVEKNDFASEQNVEAADEAHFEDVCA